MESPLSPPPPELVTLRDMLADRGYQVTKTTSEYWLATKITSSEASAAASAAAAPKPLPLKVTFIDAPKVGIDHVRGLNDQVARFSAIIIVITGLITPAAKAAITSAKLQFFHISELKHNITKHALVPKHVMLSPAEEARFLATYRVTKDRIPRIKYDDAVIKYWGFPVGSIVAIHRNFGAQIGSFIYWRVVVKNV